MKQYIVQILTLSGVSILFYFSRSSIFLHYVMMIPIATMYINLLFILLSQTYREHCKKIEVTCSEMFLAAAFAFFNIAIILDGSALRAWYGVAIALSIIVYSFTYSLKR